MTINAKGASPKDRKPRLLIVEDNDALCVAMQRAFAQRGYEVRLAHSAGETESVLKSWSPDFAVLDLRLPGAAGLTLIPTIKAANAETRVVMLTGYASIATAVEAIKLGAQQYLVKPADADAIETAFQRVNGEHGIPPSEKLLSVHRLEWEHIQRVLIECGGNVSATARALRMHRRTLQRKLNKHPAPG